MPSAMTHSLKDTLWRAARWRDSSVEGRRRQSAVQAKEITGGEAHVKRGADQDEDMEEEDVQDLISRVHMELGIRLESHMRDVDAATYCTVFFIQEALQSRKKMPEGRPNSAATQWRSMEAAKTKEVRNLLISISMLREFEEAEAVQIQRSAAENPEAAGIPHPRHSMKTTPNIREACRSAAVASDFSPTDGLISCRWKRRRRKSPFR